MKLRPRLDLHLRIGVFRRDGYQCQHCGFVGRFCDLEVDHVTPWSWGGLDQPDNFQTLCRRCNRSKGARFTG